MSPSVGRCLNQAQVLERLFLLLSECVIVLGYSRLVLVAWLDSLSMLLRRTRQSAMPLLLNLVFHVLTSMLCNEGEAASGHGCRSWGSSVVFYPVYVITVSGRDNRASAALSSLIISSLFTFY